MVKQTPAAETEFQARSVRVLQPTSEGESGRKGRKWKTKTETSELRVTTRSLHSPQKNSE